MQKYLLLFLLCLPGLSLFAQPEGPSTSVNISESNIRVGKLLKEISRQTGYDFSYNSRILDLKQNIAFEAREASLEEVLDQLSAQIGLDYQIIEGQIVLTAAAPPPPEEEYFTLSGFLSDQSTGENLISANVYIKNTNIGALTNEFGFYSLTLKKAPIR